MQLDHTLLLTGIPLIDHQHAAYARLVDAALARCAEPVLDRAALVEEVNQTLSYALEHFDSEELLMRAEDFSIRLAEQLVDWFCDHVLTDDRHFAEFLREHAKPPVA